MDLERAEPDPLVVAPDLVVHQRDDVLVVDDLLAVGEVLEAAEGVVQLVVADLAVAQRLQLVAERGPAGVLAHHQAALGPADALRRHDLVGGGVLQHPVLMDAALVGEGVAADDRLVRLHVEPGDGGQQLRDPQDALGLDLVDEGCASGRVRIAITVSSSAALPARSPMPLIVHSICRTPARTAASVLATARPRSLWLWVEKMTFSAPGTRSRSMVKMRAMSSGSGVADRVGDVDRGGAGVDRRLHAAAQEVGLGAAAVLGRPLHVVRVVAGQRHRIDGELQHRVRLHAQLVFHVQRGGGQEDVDALALGGPQRLGGAQDVGLAGAGQAADDRALDVLAMASTLSKSPTEAIGKPASITSTPSSASASAMRSFSRRFMEKPGDCSPSRSVVSKMMTRLSGTCRNSDGRCSWSVLGIG